MGNKIIYGFLNGLEAVAVAIYKVYQWFNSLPKVQPPGPAPAVPTPVSAPTYPPVSVAPVTPVVPTTTQQAFNKEGIPIAKIAAAILEQNNSQLIFALVDAYTDPVKGATIHKIDQTTATSLAVIIDKESVNWDIPMSYILACMDIESTFDPAAENGNFAGSNPAKALGGYDVGLCQFKLEYLLSASITTVEDAQVVALDPSQAVPLFYQKYTGLLAWAQSIQPQITGSAPNPKAHNVYWSATAGYNFGTSGALTQILAGDDISHCDKVTDLEQYFSKQFGTTSVMADVAA